TAQERWCAPEFLLRSGTVRLRHLSAIARTQARLPRGCAIADSEKSWRSRQDRPARQHESGQAAPCRRIDIGMDTGWTAGSLARSDSGTRGHEAFATSSKATAAGISAASWQALYRRQKQLDAGALSLV